MSTPTTESPWHTVGTAVPYTRRSRTAIIAALNGGELRGYQTKDGGKWSIHKDDLDAWMRGEAATVAPTRRSARRHTAAS